MFLYPPLNFFFSRFQSQPAGAVFAVEAEFFFLEDAKGFAGEGAPPHPLGVGFIVLTHAFGLSPYETSCIFSAILAVLK